MSSDFNQAQLDGEWQVTAALRELMTLAVSTKVTATYDQALELAKRICPEILGEDSLLQVQRESRGARRYRQQADARSRPSDEDEKVTPVELVEHDIEVLKADISAAVENRQRRSELERELRRLEQIRDELSPAAHDEHSLIWRDATVSPTNIPQIDSGAGYRDFRLEEGELLRVRVFHPGKAEHISGADIVYERHDEKREFAQVVAIQYKIWDGKELRLGDARLKDQLNKLQDFYCRRGYCSPPSEGKTYRFPYCAAFLRPTDRLQHPSQALRTSGEHIPICHINEVATEGPRGGEKITIDGIKDVSLSLSTFDDLLLKTKIGSRNLTHAELETLYEELENVDPNRCLVHAQHCDPPSSSTLF